MSGMECVVEGEIVLLLLWINFVKVSGRQNPKIYKNKIIDCKNCECQNFKIQAIYPPGFSKRGPWCNFCYRLPVGPFSSASQQAAKQPSSAHARRTGIDCSTRTVTEQSDGTHGMI